MRRVAVVFIFVVGCALSLYAQDKSKGTEMTGWICNSACVHQNAGQVACDQNCTDNTGDVVFVDDQGKVTKIANPDKVRSHMGKKVKVKGEMMEGKDMMKIYDVLLANAG